MCFHANIFGWVTDVSFSSVLVVIPILTKTRSVMPPPDATSCTHEPQLTVPMLEIITLEKKMTAFVIPNAILITTKNNKYTFASFLSRDNTYEVIHNSWRMSGADISGNGGGSMRTSFDSAESGRTGMEATRVNGVDGTKSQGGKGGPGKAPKVTKCQCGKDGTHYSEVAMEAVFPGTPEKIHNLIFASGFMKDFMREEQKLIGACLSVSIVKRGMGAAGSNIESSSNLSVVSILDLQISDWAPSANSRGNPQLLTRNMSYIKPLTASIGPRQTKCELSDEIVHCDFDDFVSTLTTTRTPDVPSGNVFSVKTKTCIMWASNVSSRVIVTTQVDWSGRSFIRGKFSVMYDAAAWRLEFFLNRDHREELHRWPEDLSRRPRQSYSGLHSKPPLRVYPRRCHRSRGGRDPSRSRCHPGTNGLALRSHERAELGTQPTWFTVGVRYL